MKVCVCLLFEGSILTPYSVSAAFELLKTPELLALVDASPETGYATGDIIPLRIIYLILVAGEPVELDWKNFLARIRAHFGNSSIINVFSRKRDSKFDEAIWNDAATELESLIDESDILDKETFKAKCKTGREGMKKKLELQENRSSAFVGEMGQLQSPIQFMDRIYSILRKEREDASDILLPPRTSESISYSLSFANADIELW